MGKITEVMIGEIAMYHPTAKLVVIPNKPIGDFGWSPELASAHEIGHWRDHRIPGHIRLTERSSDKEKIQDELNAWIHQVSRRGVTDEDKEYLEVLRQEAVSSDIPEDKFARMLVKAWRRYELKGR